RTRVLDVGNQYRVEANIDRVDVLEYGHSDETPGISISVDQTSYGDALLHRTQCGDLGKIGLSEKKNLIDTAVACETEQLGTVSLGLPEEAERIGQVFDGQARFLSEALRRQIVRVATGRGLSDLNEPLLHASLEVGIDQAQGDAELGGEVTLRSHS